MWSTAGIKADIEERARALVPMGRSGTCEEIAKCIAFLASNEVSFIVGHTLVVDGGQALASNN